VAALPAASPAFFLAAIPTVLIAAVSNGGFEGELGIASVPLRALVIPPAQAAAVNFAKLPPYLALGLFDREALTAVLALAPVAAGGMLLGVWLHACVSDRLFYATCYLFVLLTGLKLVHDGLRGLSG
jgi:uncharacterized membrane protein YfcA